MSLAQGNTVPCATWVVEVIYVNFVTAFKPPATRLEVTPPPATLPLNPIGSRRLLRTVLGSQFLHGRSGPAGGLRVCRSLPGGNTVACPFERVTRKPTRPDFAAD